MKLYGPRPCLGHRPIVDGVAQPFQFLSYNEVAETVNHVGSGYTNLGLKPKDKIGVIGPNTPEWMMAMQVCDRTVGWIRERCDSWWWQEIGAALGGSVLAGGFV